MSELVAVVDDDPDLRRIVELTLVNVGGFTCVVCASATEALEKLAGRRFHAILLDMNLGDGTGLELMRALRERGTQGPICFLTGDACNVARAEYTKAGAAGLIPKPFNPLELPSLLRACLASS